MTSKFITKKTAHNYFCFTTGIFLFIILAILALFIVSDYWAFEKEAAYEAKVQNNNIRQKISGTLLYTKHLMSYAARQIAASKSSDYASINKLLMNYRNQQNELLYWDIFAWAGVDQKLRISSGMGILKEPIDISDRDYLAASREIPEIIHVGTPIIGRLSKTRLIPISYGIVNEERKYIGSLIAGLTIENLESEISNALSSGDVLFALVTTKGEIVTKSNGLDNQENRPQFLDLLREIKKNPNREIYSSSAYYNRLSQCSDLECANYGVITLHDKSTTQSYVVAHLIYYLMAAFFAISIGGFILLNFYEHTIYPIAILSDAAQKVSHGQQIPDLPDFDAREFNQIKNSLEEIDKSFWSKKKY